MATDKDWVAQAVVGVVDTDSAAVEVVATDKDWVAQAVVGVVDTDSAAVEVEVVAVAVAAKGLDSASEEGPIGAGWAVAGGYSLDSLSYNTKQVCSAYAILMPAIIPPTSF